MIPASMKGGLTVSIFIALLIGVVGFFVQRSISAEAREFDSLPDSTRIRLESVRAAVRSLDRGDLLVMSDGTVLLVAYPSNDGSELNVREVPWASTSSALLLWRTKSVLAITRIVTPDDSLYAHYAKKFLMRGRK